MCVDFSTQTHYVHIIMCLISPLDVVCGVYTPFSETDTQFYRLRRLQTNPGGGEAAGGPDPLNNN